jgi:deazaflavin-dependent oxidoreductase (nitroreductase family)
MSLQRYSTTTAFNQPVVDEFRANGGKVGGMFEGATLALLTTVGARTGLPRTSPVGWLRIGGETVVVASAGGAPANPAWYHNLRANPWVTVEVGTDTFQALAHVAEGADRERLWRDVVAVAPGYAGYQEQTSRQLPVVVLREQHAPDGTRLRGLGTELAEIHAWLRGQLAELREETGTAPGGAGEAVARLRTHCLAFCQALTVHHTGEDGYGFPALEARFPALAPVLAELRAQHVVVARLHREMEALVTAAPDPDTVRAGLDRLSAELEEHFRHEEETLSAALNALGPAPDRRT